MSRAYDTITQADIGTGNAIPGTGADIEVTIGFKPKFVYVASDDAGSVAELRHIGGQGDGRAFKRDALGAGSLINTGITTTDRGFIIGTDADINAVGKNIFFTANP